MRPLPKGKLPVEREMEQAREEIAATVRELDKTIENSVRAQAEREQKVDDIRGAMRGY